MNFEKRRIRWPILALATVMAAELVAVAGQQGLCTMAPAAVPVGWCRAERATLGQLAAKAYLVIQTVSGAMTTSPEPAQEQRFPVRRP